MQNILQSIFFTAYPVRGSGEVAGAFPSCHRGKRKNVLYNIFLKPTLSSCWCVFCSANQFNQPAYKLTTNFSTQFPNSLIKISQIIHQLSKHLLIKWPNSYFRNSSTCEFLLTLCVFFFLFPSGHFPDRTRSGSGSHDCSTQTNWPQQIHHRKVRRGESVERWVLFIAISIYFFFSLFCF